VRARSGRQFSCSDMAPRNSNARTGSANPFSWRRSTSVKANPCDEPASCTPSDTSTDPGADAAHRRLARLTVGPKRSPSRSTGSPDASPIRTPSGVKAAAFLDWNPSRIASAASRASETSSNEAMMPSPVCLISRPRDARSAFRTIRSCSFKSSMNSACSSLSAKAVEPSMSVKRIVRKALVTSDSSAGLRTTPRN
jgi:hypothetical protein